MTPASIDGLMAGPALYPFQVDWLHGQAWLLETDEAFYRDAAFLDQRALRPSSRASWVALALLERAADTAAPRPLGLIFHVGHCGSTLLSRALGLAPDFFSLREPLPLRDLAAMQAELGAPWAPLSPADLVRHERTLRALWSRTPRPGQLAVLKATSFCSVIAAAWLKRHGIDRAVLLAMSPERFIATVVSAPDYVVDLKGGARTRMLALAAATGAQLQPMYSLSAGELAALTVLAELVNLDLAADLAGARALRVDFDAYLGQPEQTLQAITRHFGVEIPAAQIAAILRDPLLTRYSKSTDYAFSAGERTQRLVESHAAHGAEIERGLRWLQSFAAGNAVAARALRQFGYAD